MKKAFRQLIIPLSVALSFISFIPKSKVFENDNSIFWEISGKDLEKPSYLFGTFHLLNEYYLQNFKGWPKCLKASDAVIVEMVLDSSKMTDMVGKMISPDTTLDKLLSKSEYEQTSAFFKEVSGFDLSLFNSLKPISLSVLLTTYTWAKLKPEDYVQGNLPMDLYLAKKGKDEGKEIIPLETMEQQMALLYDGITLKKQKEKLMEMVIAREETKESILRMDECYRKQELECLKALFYSSKNYSEEEMNTMVVSRNKEWMKTILKTIQSKPSFIAVGAGHLPGKDGLLNLLRKEGYLVRRQLF